MAQNKLITQTQTQKFNIPPSEIIENNQDLISQIKEVIYKLENDSPPRGDLKLINKSLKELRYALKVFKDFRSHKKVTVFGSSRTRENDRAYKQTEEFGREMAIRDWMVITGAANGIMEAGHRGAGRSHSMGLGIRLPFESISNPIIKGDPKLVSMKYFFTRKIMFLKECNAVVCLPGGFGTLDEAFEALTLLQTGKRDMIPVVLLDEPGGVYWRNFHDYIVKNLLQTNTISEEDLSLYHVTDNLQDAVNEVTHFYKIYHSMRYVGKKLVFRLNRSINHAAMIKINNDFTDILTEGRFVLRSALSEEKNEPVLKDLPRLVFSFNRRNNGRLRMLINELNCC